MDIDLSDEENNEVDEKYSKSRKMDLDESLTVSSHELQRSVRPQIPSHRLEKRGFEIRNPQKYIEKTVSIEDAAELSDSAFASRFYPPKVREPKVMEQKGIAQSGVLNQNDVVKKIARKREGLDDSIDSI